MLHEFFDQAVRAQPERNAIEAPAGSQRLDRRSITYLELQRAANGLACFLRDFVKEECVVVLLLPRDSEHLYLAQLAVLKAGAAYTCIDPAFPDEQVRAILEDAQAAAILTDAAGLVRARRVKPEVECFLDVIDWCEQFDEPFEAPEPAPWLTQNSLAYIIYTSGTTGRPKG